MTWTASWYTRISSIIWHGKRWRIASEFLLTRRSTTVCGESAVWIPWRSSWREAPGNTQQKKKKIKRTDSLETQVADEKNELKGQSPKTSKASSDDIALLKKQVKELQMKVDVMTEVFEILKKGKGTDIKA